MLTRKQARNQAVNIGGFPPIACDQIEKDGYVSRGGQGGVMKNIAERIAAGQMTLMNGPPGVGKTHIASAFGYAWYLRGVFRKRDKARYFTLAGLMREEKGSFEDKKRDSPLDKARACGYLVIDEITPQNDSVFDSRELRDLLDERHRTKKATILITNIATAKLSTIFDEPTLDRILEGKNGIITLLGNSHR